MLGKQWIKRSGAALMAAILLLSGTGPAAAQQTAGTVKAAGKELAADSIKKAPENFYLTEEGLVYFFQLYDIAPYASGIQKVIVSLPEG